MLVTPVLDFLYIREVAFAVAAIADKCLPQVWTLTFVRVPTALNGRRRVRVRGQGRLVILPSPIIFCMLHSDSS